MKIFIKAKPNAGEEKVEKIDDSHYIVSVTAPPVKGLANLFILKALSEYFKVPKSNVQMISGYKSREKVFLID